MKDYILDNGRVRCCDSNIARMNIIEYMYYVGDDMHTNIKCASVSEYGMSSTTELFAEVGAAVSFGIEIDSDVKKAYIKTMESIR